MFVEGLLTQCIVTRPVLVLCNCIASGLGQLPSGVMALQRPVRGCVFYGEAVYSLDTETLSVD